MKEQNRGKIINIASGTFFSGPASIPHYVASKGGSSVLPAVVHLRWESIIKLLTPSLPAGLSMKSLKIRKLLRYARAAYPAAL
jgi:short-subunit dehydrogenase involved in D-alanine esterification of teichoic acids